MVQILRLFVFAIVVGYFVSTANGESVLLIGPSPSGLFTAGGLTQYGHTVVNGPTYDAFDGSIDLSAYDVVVLSAVDYARPTMSQVGQQSIADFVAHGGGLITGEWTTWKNSFDVLMPLFPTTTDGSYIGGAGWMISVRYAQDTPDPIINAGLPSSMDFVVDAAGSEIIVPKAGATVFYSGDSISPYYSFTGSGWEPQYGVAASAGLVGWQYGQGRVLNFSTTMQQPIGPDYTDNYSRLVANAITWAGAGSATAVPEPNSLALFILGGFGIVFALQRRQLGQ